MDINDIKKLNYLGSMVKLPYNYLEQCLKDKGEKKLFYKSYNLSLKSVFEDNELVSAMLSNILEQMADLRFIRFEGGYNNYVTLSLFDLYYQIISFLCSSNNKMEDILKNSKFKNELTIVEAAKEYKNILKILRKKIDEYKNQESLRSDFNPLISLCDKKQKYIGNQINNAIIFHNFNDHKTKLQECLTNLICYSDHMLEKYSKYGFDLKCIENFDNEKYMFIVFCENIRMIKEYGYFKNEIYPILTYITNSIEKDNDKLYYYKYNKDTQKFDIKYTYKDFLMEVNDYIKNNPKLNFDPIPVGFFDEWDYNDINEFLDLYSDDSDKNFEIIDPEYIFLPSGSINNRLKTTDSLKAKDDDINAMKLTIEKRSFYDMNRDKIHTMLLGKNRFKGYVANILNNGYVIFEKYDIVNNCLSNKLGAAYIMNIDSFNELSKKNIQELRRMTNDQSSDLDSYHRVNYICHRGNWQERLQPYFNQKTGVSEESINQIVINSSDSNIRDNKKIYVKSM